MKQARPCPTCGKRMRVRLTASEFDEVCMNRDCALFLHALDSKGRVEAWAEYGPRKAL